MYKLRRLVYDYVMRRCIKWMDGKKTKPLPILCIGTEYT